MTIKLSKKERCPSCKGWGFKFERIGWRFIPNKCSKCKGCRTIAVYNHDYMLPYEQFTMGIAKELCALYASNAENEETE